MRNFAAFLSILLFCCSFVIAAEQNSPPQNDKTMLEPLYRAVDLTVGQSQDVALANGDKITVKLVGIDEKRDELRNAVRRALVTVEVGGKTAVLTSATYNLPVVVDGVQIDCPVTKGYVQKDSNPWSLDADARLRIWPAGSPWIRPGTFLYPLRQRWFAGQTLMTNEIGDDERVGDESVYYHWGLDFGGSEDQVEVQAATDGQVVSARGDVLQPGEYPPMVAPRYDVIYIRDARGWFYRYSHLNSIDPAIKVGGMVKMGQTLGLLGKEGASGGWTHLHFDIVSPQPSGRYGQDDAYAFVWQAYRQEYSPVLVAIARPRMIAWAGSPLELDAARSWSELGPGGIKSYEWSLSNGKTALGPSAVISYERAGTYSEILKVTDVKGRVDYDFAVVSVSDRKQPDLLRPYINAAYWPTFGIKPGDPVTFKVRSFNVKPDEGQETWDFGDGSPLVAVRSDGNQNAHAKNGYAVVTHSYKEPGHYIASVSRTNNRGETATVRLQVRVENSAK